MNVTTRTALDEPSPSAATSVSHAHTTQLETQRATRNKASLRAIAPNLSVERASEYECAREARHHVSFPSDAGNATPCPTTPTLLALTSLWGAFTTSAVLEPLSDATIARYPLRAEVEPEQEEEPSQQDARSTL
jgi:hypothetical protein